MASGDEVVSPATDQPAPIARDGGGIAGARPTAADVLAWIASAKGEPWFPLRHAAATGADRDALDDPLNQLRMAGLVRVADWERGMGQGYVLTPQGEAALAAGGAIPKELSESKVVDALEAPTIRRPPPIPIDSRQPIVVPVLFFANLLWFFVGLVMVLRAGLPVWPYLSEGYIDILHRQGAVNGLDLFRGEWWRLASSCFVHIGGAHLLLNLFALIVIGPLAELLWGRGRLIIIYVLSGLAGSCLAMALKPDSMLAGASGAIWGLLTSLVAWLMLFGRTLDPEEAAESKRRLTVVIVLNAMFSLMPGISWQGHLGGAVAGFVVAVLLNAISTGDRSRRVLALVLLVAFGVGTVGGLLSAMRWNKSWAGYRERIAAEAYDRNVAPLLAQLSPAQSNAAIVLAGNQLTRTGERRNPARVAEVRVRLIELKGIADSVVGHLDVPPVGSEALHRRREQAKAFAAARSKSFAIVLGMLDSPAIPEAAVWSAWVAAKNEADALWPRIAR
jgi:membrane associated rhomboid family serine protease